MSWFFASWKLSEGDVQALSMLGKSASRNEAALAGEGDSVHGKAVFEKRCTGCSAMEADREGPHLAGVFGGRPGVWLGLPRTIGELRAKDIEWLRWIAANVDDQDSLRRC